MSKKMNENDYIASMVELHECLKKRYIKCNDIINLAKKDFLNGIIDLNMYDYTVQYFSLIERIQNYKDTYIDINESIENNIFESINTGQQPINLSENIFNNILYNYSEFIRDKNVKYNMYNEDISQVCIICFSRKKEILMSPCNHSVLCLFCLNEIVKGIKGLIRCPICCIKVEKVSRV